VNAPHDRPTAAELIQAAMEYLEREVCAEDEQARRFHSRVAARALAIAGRELERAAADRRAHETRMHELGFADSVELGDALRARRIPGAELGAVRRALEADAVAKVRVSNPLLLGTRTSEVRP
jgi:hypothetical protein